LQETEIKTLLTYLNQQIIENGNRQKDTEKMLLEDIAGVKNRVAEKKKYQIILDALHVQERELRKQLPPEPETHEREFYAEIGHKGGQHVRKLIQEGKEHEE
jgi:hypothetical protein